MGDAQAKITPKAKRSRAKHQPVPDTGVSRQAHQSTPSGLGPFYAAGPAMGLGTPVQTKVAIGQANDAYEREADAVAERAISGTTAPAITPLAPGALSTSTQQQEEMQEEAPRQTATLQRQMADKEEEPLQTLAMQRQEEPEEETPVETSLLQRQAIEEDEEPLPTQSVQRQITDEEEEPGQTPAMQRQEETEDEEPLPTQSVQRQMTDEEEEPVQTQPIQRQMSEDEEEPLQTPAVQRQEMADDEELLQTPAVQRQPEDMDEEPQQSAAVQRQVETEEEEPVQALAMQRQPEEDAEQIQTDQAAGGSSTTATSMQAAASHAISRTGAGEPLQSQTRSALESSLGADLSHVRVHDDSTAHETASALHARAFTHGHDIWLGRGASQNDLRLMAHEATHVVQQTGSVQRYVVQRATNPNPDADTFSQGGSTLDTTNKELSLANLRVPSAKSRRMSFRPIEWKPNAPETSPRQNWDDDVKGATDAKIDTTLQDVAPVDIEGQRVYYLKSRRQDNYLIGTSSQIKARVRRPTWDKRGETHAFDVDHIQETQLSGPDQPSNYWLWDASANRSSGSLINAEVRQRIQEFLEQAKPTLGIKTPTPGKVEKQYTVTFPSVRGGLPVSGAPGTFWEREEIQAGEHIDLLKVLKAKEIEEVRGGETSLSIFTSATGGNFHQVPWKANQTSATGNFRFYDNCVVQQVDYQPGGSGTVTGVAFKNNKYIKDQPIALPIAPKSGVEYGGYISGGELASKLSDVQFKGASPVQIQHAELIDGKGVVARGRLSPTIPLIKDAGIDLVIDGNDVYLSKVFDIGEFAFPGPVQVTESTLELFAGTQGLGVRGTVRGRTRWPGGTQRHGVDRRRRWLRGRRQIPVRPRVVRPTRRGNRRLQRRQVQWLGHADHRQRQNQGDRVGQRYRQH